MKIKDYIIGFFRLIYFISLSFCTYNFALLLSLCFGYAMFKFYNLIFTSITHTNAFSDVLIEVFNFMCLHSTAFLIVFIILYVLGYLWFLYKFVNRIANDIILNEN